MKTLKNWTAKRAGAFITINGVDVETGGPLKVVGIDRIFPTASGLIAQKSNGDQYSLSATVSV